MATDQVSTTKSVDAKVRPLKSAQRIAPVMEAPGLSLYLGTMPHWKRRMAHVGPFDEG